MNFLLTYLQIFQIPFEYFPRSLICLQLMFLQFRLFYQVFNTQRWDCFLQSQST